jgi:hypothetical protein
VVPVLIALTVVFAVLFFARLGGAHRATLLRRWPAVALAGAAFLALTRGAIGPAAGLLSLSVAVWLAWPAIEAWRRRAPPVQSQDSPEDSAARATLGVGPNASPDEIRRAYRAKMAQAHPDRGGSHNEAARLTAARDRLLKRRAR